MALMLEITKADGSVARTPLESQATKVGAWPGGKVRVIDTATGKAPADLTAKRVGDSLIVENLPDGKTVEITKFYTDCSPAAPCALVIDPANAAEAVTITQTTPPIATLGENQALMYGPTSSSGAAAAAPAGGGIPTGAVLAGLALVGVAAAAAGGGGGGGSKTPADTTPPDAPVVNTVAGDGVVDAGEAAAGVAVSGTAEAGSTVTVTWGSTVKTATADAGGNWSVNFAPAELPADGPSTVSVTARDAAGNVSRATEQTVTIDAATPDTTPPDAPVIGAVAGDNVVNAAEAAAGVEVSGAAEAGSTVAVTWGSTTKTATADSSGNWSVSFAQAELPAHGDTAGISATATDTAGNTSSVATHPVSIDTEAPELQTPNVAPNGIVSGTAEPGSTVTMDDQTETADASTGAYQFATPLASGATASVVATDAAGNASAGIDVTAVTRQAGTDGDNLILAGTTGFVDGGDGNDVLVGGDGGSVRNYQFEYWDTSAAGSMLANLGNAFTLGPLASNGWTMSDLVESLDGRHTSGPVDIGMNIVAQTFSGSHADNTGGGGRFYFDTVRNPATGGAVVSQDILTREGASYTLSMQISSDDYDTSLAVYWGGTLLATWDTDANAGAGGWSGTPPDVDTSGTRQTLTWTVAGGPDPTTALEIRAYSAKPDSGVEGDGRAGWGILIDRVTLDAADTGETLAGGAGRDLLFGQGGDDVLYGGALGSGPTDSDGDADTFVYSMRTDNGNDVIRDFEVGVDRIYLVDALDTVTTDSKLPGMANSETATTNSDTNLTSADFILGTSASQYLVVSDDGNGSVKLSFFGGSTDGATATELGSVVLEGVAFGTEAGQYDTVEDLFAGPNPVLVATMDGFHAGLLTPPV